MAKYELTETQVRNLQVIIQNATITLKEAQTMADLLKTLSTPIVPKKEEKK